MTKLFKVLRFFRITDDSDNLSITNLIIIVLGVRIASMDTIDPVTMIGFVMSLLQYGHKRQVTLHSQNKEMDMQTAIDDMQTQINETLEESQQQLDSYTKKQGKKLKDHSDMLDKLKTAVGFKKLGQ